MGVQRIANTFKKKLIYSLYKQLNIMASQKSKIVKKANQNTPPDIYIDEAGFAYKIDPKSGSQLKRNDIVYEYCPNSKCTIGQSYNGLIKKYSSL